MHARAKLPHLGPEFDGRQFEPCRRKRRLLPQYVWMLPLS